MDKINNENDSVLMNLRIDEELRKKFKIKTLENDTTMTEAIVDFIKKYVNK